MGKMKLLLRRIRRMDFSRMQMHIKQVAKQSGKPRALIFLDMVWCALRYGVGYLDYNVFGFAFVRGKKKRSTYMTMRHNEMLTARVNDPDYRDRFVDKTEFNAIFDAHLGRAWLDLRKTDAEGLAQFMQGKTQVFVKQVDSCGGKSVERIEISQETNAQELYALLMQNAQYLVEDALQQHPEMMRMNPSCINTLRITSLVRDGEVHIMYCLVRIGDGSQPVDNISRGGMYCPVGEYGVITAPAFCDAIGGCYTQHPATEVPFVGFAIPFYSEAIAMIAQAALLVPQVRYVGWDVAITPQGPVLVEGNVVPSYDMCQNYAHVQDQGGILPKFQMVYGRNFADLARG